MRATENTGLIPEMTFGKLLTMCVAPKIDGDTFISMCDTLRQLDGEELLKFGRSVLQSSQFYQYLFIQCRNKIPKDQLYKTTMDTYFFSGFDFPKQAILDIMDLRPDDYLKDLPKLYESCDAIPVVRATKTPPIFINNVANELSWTTRYDYVQSMFTVKEKFGDCYLYFGTIDKEDIIGCNAFEDDGFEIVQYKAVKNLIPVHPAFLLHRLKRSDTSLNDYDEIEQYNDELEIKMQLVKDGENKNRQLNRIGRLPTKPGLNIVSSF